MSFNEISNFVITVNNLFFAGFETVVKFVFLMVLLIEPSHDGIGQC